MSGQRVNRKLPEGFEIFRVETGRAYAVSGNAHNATKRYRYDLYVQGVRMDSSESLSKFVAYVNDHADEYLSEAEEMSR